MDGGSVTGVNVVPCGAGSYDESGCKPWCVARHYAWNLQGCKQPRVPTELVGCLAGAHLANQPCLEHVGCLA